MNQSHLFSLLCCWHFKKRMFLESLALAPFHVCRLLMDISSLFFPTPTPPPLWTFQKKIYRNRSEMNLAQVQTVWDNKQMDCASLNVKGKLNKPKGTASMDCNHIGLVRTYHSFVIKKSTCWVWYQFYYTKWKTLDWSNIQCGVFFFHFSVQFFSGYYLAT